MTEKVTFEILNRKLNKSTRNSLSNQKKMRKKCFFFRIGNMNATTTRATITMLKTKI